MVLEEMVAESLRPRKLVELQAVRIAVLEKLIEEVRRGGKRQSAPFSVDGLVQVPSVLHRENNS